MKKYRLGVDVLKPMSIQASHRVHLRSALSKMVYQVEELKIIPSQSLRDQQMMSPNRSMKLDLFPCRLAEFRGISDLPVDISLQAAYFPMLAVETTGRQEWQTRKSCQLNC